MLKYLKYALCNCMSGEYVYSITITHPFKRSLYFIYEVV